MSRTLSTKYGSADSLKVSLRCGCREKACQMRWMVEAPYPVARAIERRLQWVASGGVSSSVMRTTSATSSSPMRRGAPERGASCRPSRRSSAKRRRHLPTVNSVTSNKAAISLSESPSAAASTIRALNARACHDLRLRLSRSNSLRSSSVRVMSTAVLATE